MTRSMRAFTSLAVALGLALPALAFAQAVPRPGTAGGSTASPPPSGSSGGGSTGSSSSGSSGGGSSSTSGGSGPTSASGRPMFSDPESRTPSRVSSSGSRSGTATARPAPVPGGVAGGGGDSSSSSRVGSTFPSTFGADGESARSRNGRPVTGAAVLRGPGLVGGDDFVSFPLFGPWGRWYPWYTSGFGWNYGFVTYNPWRYGATRWIWGRYGMWYDPWDYYWDPYWSSPGYYSVRNDREPSVKNTIGSLRIKANVAEAKVYIDGALVGTVDEFDGLKDHLDLESGRHTIELRAEGYDAATQEIEVKAGKTQTVRLSLKAKKK